MASRGRAQSASLRADEIEYFLFIQGLSPQCRWQELKDVIRKVPPDGHIRQAHTDNDNGTGWGHITILNRRKAFDAYDYLYSNGWRGHSIRLTLVVKDESDPNTLRRLRGPEDSLVYSSQRYHHPGHSYPPPASSALSPPVPSISARGSYGCGGTNTYANPGASSLAPMYSSALPITMQPLVPLQTPAPQSYNSCSPSTIPGSQRLVQQSTTSSHPAQHNRQKTAGKRATTKASATVPPVLGNASSDPADNEGRTVYLYNLPYTVSPQAIKEHLASAGVVDRCLVKEDRQRSSKYKLTAVVTFRTPQQAQTAIDRFNRTTWKGYEIKVKLDRGPTASGVSGNGKEKCSRISRVKEDRRETREGPLVVNGSGPSISNRQTRVDSDDESSCDEDMADLSRRSRPMRV